MLLLQSRLRRDIKLCNLSGVHTLGGVGDELEIVTTAKIAHDISLSSVVSVFIGHCGRPI